MKFIEKRIRLLLLMTMTIFFVGCVEKDDAPQEEINYSAEETKQAARTDNVAEGTFDIMEAGFDENTTTPLNLVSLFPNCTTITVTTNGNGGTIVLDFGDGCQLNNGAVVSGIIRLEYSPILSGSRTITYTFEDYVYNNNGVTGGGEILRQIANSNGNPQSTVVETITVSFPNTTVTATRDGTRTIEWTEGVGTGTWIDNVYEITGNWNTLFSNGFLRTGEVTETLVRKLDCLYLVSGVLEIQQEGFTGAIDWGNGECDDMATLTINGYDFPIVLGN
ncbi:hypothetical protein [Ulvibacter antarcticus]|uniref:Uncharacterized protein n=1 Tax=Ulvibacter antarcticus TaxID=442714 RepID=A0A3L9YAG6_9FLAO|nr:hypothetical protein [Ulvibacter antarcticus]RMA57723.1 hypothetical protein BXY75_2528 [Ulvibacter antarcticus]